MPQANFVYNGQNYIVNSDTNPPTIWKIQGTTPVITQPDSQEMVQQAVYALNNVQPRSAADVAASGGGPGGPTSFPTVTNPVAGTATQPVFQGTGAAPPEARTAAQVAGSGGAPSAPTSFPTSLPPNPIAGTATQPVFQSTTPTAPPVARTASQVAGGGSPAGWPNLQWPQLTVPGVTLPTITNPLAGTATAPVFQTSDPNAANQSTGARTAAQVASSGTGGSPAPPSAAAPSPTTAAANTPAAPAAAAPAAAAPATSGGTPASPSLAAAQQKVLDNAQRGNWRIIGDTDEYKNRTVTDEYGTTSTVYGPTGNKIWAISGPDGKNQTITVAPSTTDPGGFEVVKPPPDLPKDNAPTGNSDTGWYARDANGQWALVIPPHTPNADDEIKKAVDRQDAEQIRNEKAANQAAGRGYQTDSDYASMISQANKDKISAAQLAENIRQYDTTQGRLNKEYDTTRAAQDKLDAASIAKTGAEVTNLGATTRGTEATTQRTTAMLPGELAQQVATREGTEASTAATRQATQISGAPQLKGTVGGANVLTTVNPLSGQVDQSQMDLAFQPKTQAEIAARVGQINSVMQAKSAQVQGKVGQMIGGKQYTADDALKEFNSWYGSQVAPQTDALKAAQDEAAFQRAKEQATQRTAAFTAANAASTSAINAFNALKGANPVENPAAFNSAAADLAKGKIPSNLAEATTWHGPNPIALSQMATMNALKYIDPTAAAATGAPPPNYQTMDIGALTRNPYAAPGVPGAQPMPFTGATPTPQPMPNPGGQTPPMQPMAAPAPAQGQQSPDWWNAVMNRQSQSVDEQRRQASAMPMQTPPGMYNPQFQAMYPSAVGQPATGPVVGNSVPMPGGPAAAAMPDWLRNGTPPDATPTRPTLTSDGTPTGQPIVGEGPADWWNRFIKQY